MATPTIHINGTPGADLFNQYTQAFMAVEAAIDAVTAASPHMRDYYPQAPEEWAEARTDHEDRLRDLNRIAIQLKALAIHCMP